MLRAKPFSSVTALLSDPQRLLDETQAATVLGVRPQTLRLWRSARRPGPPWIKLGLRSVRYRVRDLVEFLEQSRVAAGA